MLELRPNCELCDRDLDPQAPDARICSYECTFCADCVTHVLHDVCPNCGGAFVPRPYRPRQAWRDGVGLSYHPPSVTRRRCRITGQEMAEFSRRLRNLAPQER